MRSYEAARRLHSFLGTCAWVVIIAGAFVAFGGINMASQSFRGAGNEMQVILAGLPGAILAVAGFFALAMVQMGRAAVDTAELTQQVLQVTRAQLEVSREALEQGKAAATSYAELLKPQPAAKANGADTATNANPEPSYGNRSVQTETVDHLADDAAPSISAEQASDAKVQLEHTPSKAADDLLPNDEDATPALEIHKVGGTFLVGNKAFKTAREAEAYATANAD